MVNDIQTTYGNYKNEEGDGIQCPLPPDDDDPADAEAVGVANNTQKHLGGGGCKHGCVALYFRSCVCVVT